MIFSFVTPAVLGTSASIHTVPTVRFEPQPSLYYLVVTKVTTTHLVIESSRSFDYPINTRVPERPALADIIDLLFPLLFLCTLSI